QSPLRGLSSMKLVSEGDFATSQPVASATGHPLRATTQGNSRPPAEGATTWKGRQTLLLSSFAPR
ncbi:MAG TPA: hypothetical protein VEY08_08875, partial [Chloroflexia bacterium]|nr:hypothetical protein [Chloroflexia bacterium]